MQDIRWIQRFNNYKKALKIDSSLEEAQRMVKELS